MCGLRAATEIVAEDAKASTANIVSKLVGVAQAQGLLLQPAATMMMGAAQVMPPQMMMGQMGGMYSGQIRMTTRPTMIERGIGPKKRLSWEFVRLSPMTK